MRGSPKSKEEKAMRLKSVFFNQNVRENGKQAYNDKQDEYAEQQYSAGVLIPKGVRKHGCLH